MNIIEFNNVWEMYRIKFVRNKKVFWEEFWALEDISFKICKGEALGIVGDNGAGKTTLLKLVSGMLVADRGEVKVNGKVSGLMELGAGFNPEFTGRENIILNSRIYGLDENEIDQTIGSIIEFADIGKFIDAPVRCYSQGMYMRLAFALAIFVEPDILLIDDILAVGDVEAQQKCVKKIFELRESGKTIILVSHDTNMVEKLCDRALILEKGKIMYTGLPKEVVPRYLETVGDKRGISTLEGDNLRVVINNGRIMIDYDKGTITKGSGGCVSAFRETLNNRMSSLNLRWKVLSSSLNEIITEGYYMDGTVSQRWILRVYENELEWHIENKDDFINELCVDLALITGYETWITSNKKGDFGLFSHKVDWEEVANFSYYNNIVGLKRNFKNDTLPFIGIEIARHKNRYFRLFNTGYNQVERVVKLSCIGDDLISLRIKLFPCQETFNKYINEAVDEFLQEEKKERERHLRETAKEEACLIESRTIGSEDLRVFADADSKTIRIYYKDKEVTKSQGLQCDFMFNSIIYNIYSSDWQIEKKDKALLIHLKWEQIKLGQEWRIFIKDNRVCWQVCFDNERPFNFGFFKLTALFTPEYKTFFCGCQETAFPEEFDVLQDMFLEDKDSDFFGLRKQFLFPAIVLESEEGFPCVIQNSDAESSCRIFQLNIPELSFEKGRKTFSANISFLEDEKLIENYIREERERHSRETAKEEARLIESRTIYSGDLRVFADVENKSIRIYYKDKEVTKSQGLQCDFMFNSIIYNIYSSDWQIEKKDRALLIHLKWEQIKLGQEWRIVIKDNRVCWQVCFDNERPFNFGFFKLTALFTSEYKTFFCGCQETAFPEEFDVFQDMFLEDKNSDFFGLRKQFLFPAVVLESVEKLPCVIQNSDAESSCRIFQLNIPELSFEKGRKTFSTNISFLEDEKLIENYIREERERHLRETAKEEACLIESRTIYSGDLRVFADVENKSIRIYYKEVEVTAGWGIYSIFYTSEKGYDFSQCKWNMNKLSNNKIVLNLYYEAISLLQIWELICEEGNSLKIKIEVEVKESISFVNQDVKIELNDIFKSWATAYEGGNFEVNDYINDIGPIKLKDNKISKIVLEAKDKADCVKLFFGVFSNLEKNIIDICKRRGKNKEYSCINASLIFPGKDSLVKAGKYTYFDGKIVLGNDFVLKENVKSNGFAIMAKKDVKFIFERGRGKIFWKGKELTTGLGIYSSIRSKGVWYDSYQAIWRVEHKDENGIVAIGDWVHIPVSQIWKLELIDENIISLDIDMRIHSSIKLELEQTNIMLISRYKKWVASNLAQGEFLDDYTKDYDIIPFRFWYGKVKEIGAFSSILPKIMFKCGMEQDIRGIVENSDTLYEARLLQYQRINRHEVFRDNCQYFKGVIEICNNE